MIRDVNMETDKVEVVSVLRDTEVGIVRDSMNDEDYFLDTEEPGDYVYFEDREERSLREDDRHRRNFEGPDEGGLIIKAPTGFSWPVVGTILLAIGTSIFNISAFYFRQDNFNTDIVDRVSHNSEAIKSLQDNTYTKREMDLKDEKTSAEIKRLEQVLNLTKEDVDHIKRR